MSPSSWVWAVHVKSVDPAAAPAWLAPLVARAADLDPHALSRFRPPATGARASAVLILFGEDPEHGRDVLLTERAGTLRSHSGQAAFPGGSVDPGDAGPVDTALREATEEVGLDRSGVDPVAVLPDLYIPFSGFAVTPVVGWWRSPGAVGVVDEAEVARVVRAPIDRLVDPAYRFTVTHPSGYSGPGFDVDGLFVWGFTAGLLDRVLDIGGLSRPWDSSVRRPLPQEVSR